MFEKLSLQKCTLLSQSRYSQHLEILGVFSSLASPPKELICLSFPMGNAITIDELEEAYSTAEIQSRFFEILDTPNAYDMPTPEPFYYDAKTPEAYEPFGMLPLDVWNLVAEYLAVPELRTMSKLPSCYADLPA